MKVLSDFKNMEEKKMALTLLHISANQAAKVDSISKIVHYAFEANKDGTNSAKKDSDDKKQGMQWNVDVLARGFRESCPTLNWNSVFDSLGSVVAEEIPSALEGGMDAKQF